MSDDQFIFILKSKLKLFYQENKSVGLELKELVADFREQILHDFCKNQKQPRSIKKK